MLHSGLSQFGDINFFQNSSLRGETAEIEFQCIIHDKQNIQLQERVSKDVILTL